MSRPASKYDRKKFDFHALEADNIDRLTLDMVPQGSRVLELGCSTGFHSRYLEKEKGCTVIGVDFDPTVIPKATKNMHMLIIASLDDEETWGKINQSGPYDIVLASNLIEHLIDPWITFKRIEQVLKPGGSAVIAVPNIAFWRSRLRLLRGIWKYEDYGIFDRTHIKFFTIFSLREALLEAKLKPVAEGYDPAGGAKWFTPILKLFPNAYAHQVVIRAQKEAESLSSSDL